MQGLTNADLAISHQSVISTTAKLHLPSYIISPVAQLDKQQGSQSFLEIH